MLYGRPPLIVKLEIGNMDNASTAAVLIRDKDEIGYAYSSQSYQILRIYSLRSVH